jgi:hypothetical protein
MPVKEIERKSEEAILDRIADEWDSHVNGLISAERR